MFNASDLSLRAEVVIRTIRPINDYSYFTVGGYTALIEDKEVSFDFDLTRSYTESEHIIRFELYDPSNDFDTKITFEDFKKIDKFTEFYYMQDIEKKDRYEIQEKIQVLSFSVYNEDDEEYKLPNNIINTINNYTNKLAQENSNSIQFDS